MMLKRLCEPSPAPSCRIRISQTSPLQPSCEKPRTLTQVRPGALTSRKPSLTRAGVWRAHFLLMPLLKPSSASHHKCPPSLYSMPDPEPGVLTPAQNKADWAPSPGSANRSGNRKPLTPFLNGPVVGAGMCMSTYQSSLLVAPSIPQAEFQFLHGPCRRASEHGPLFRGPPPLRYLTPRRSLGSTGTPLQRKAFPDPFQATPLPQLWEGNPGQPVRRRRRAVARLRLFLRAVASPRSLACARVDFSTGTAFCLLCLESLCRDCRQVC